MWWEWPHTKGDYPTLETVCIHIDSCPAFSVCRSLTQTAWYWVCAWGVIHAGDRSGLTSQLSLLCSLTGAAIVINNKGRAAKAGQVSDEWVHLTEIEQLWQLKMLSLSRIPKVKTSHTDTFGGHTAVRSTGRARLFVQRGDFKQVLTGKMFGTGQNRSFKRGVRLSRVFVRRGSTVHVFHIILILTAVYSCGLTSPSGVSDGHNMPHCDGCNDRGPLTFLVFSNWLVTRVMWPRAEMNERRERTWVTPERSIRNRFITQLP